MRWVSLEDAGRLSLNSVAANALREGLGLRAEEPSRPGAPLLFITGPPAAGKSSVARALCSRLERAAHIEVDLIRHMVISGYASPIAGVSDPLAAAAQNELQTANVVALARNFSLTGFHTILDLLLEAPEDLDQYLEVLAETGSIYLVTLMPALATLQRRDEGRPPAVRQGERVEAAYRSISSKNEVRGLRIDNTGLDIERTVSQIITNLDQARVV